MRSPITHIFSLLRDVGSDDRIPGRLPQVDHLLDRFSSSSIDLNRRDVWNMHGPSIFGSHDLLDPLLNLATNNHDIYSLEVMRNSPCQPNRVQLPWPHRQSTLMR